MHDPSERNVFDRLDRLERQNRTLRRGGSAALVLLAVGLLLGTARETPRVVEAEKFVVRDANGEERVVIGLDHATAPEHSPVRVALYDKQHDSSAVMYLSDAFAGLVVTSRAPDARGAWSAQLFSNPQDGSGLKINTAKKKVPVRLGLAKDGAPSLVLEDDAGNALFKAPEGRRPR